MPRRLLLALAFGPLGACLGALGLSIPAGATVGADPTSNASAQFNGAVPADAGPVVSLVLQAVACADWDAIPANFTPDAPRDDTFGRYRLWGPRDPQLVRPVPSSAIGAGCHFVDGVQFRLSGTPYGNGLFLTQRDDQPGPYPAEATTLLDGATGRDGAGTLHAAAAQLTDPQRSALVDGVGLWVAAAGMPGEFANLRCHDDRYNADNLEVLRAGSADGEVACVLYMIDAGPVPSAGLAPDATSGQPSLPGPTVGDPTLPDVAPTPGAAQPGSPAAVGATPDPAPVAAVTGDAGTPPVAVTPVAVTPVAVTPVAVAPVAVAPTAPPGGTVSVNPATAADPSPLPGSSGGDGVDASADRGVNAGGTDRSAGPPQEASPLDPLAVSLRAELTVSLQVRKVGLGPLASTWGADGVVVAYRCGDEPPKKLKLDGLSREPARSLPLGMAGGALCEVAVEGPPAPGDEPAPRILIDGVSAAAGETVTLSVQPGGRRHVAVLVELSSVGLGVAEVATGGSTTDTSLVAAGPVATGGSQLTAPAAVGLGALFLAGLGLSVVAARRPL